MRQSVLVHELADGPNDVLVRNELVKTGGTVLLHPRQVDSLRGRGVRLVHLHLFTHGCSGPGTQDAQDKVVRSVFFKLNIPGTLMDVRREQKHTA